MNYDEIAKALEEEKKLNDELGKIIEEPSYYDPTHYEDEEGNIKPIPTKTPGIIPAKKRAATLSPMTYA